MDVILNVFERLNLDASIFPTFFIVILFYFLLYYIFFKPLLSVIMTREEKTTKLEEEANQKSQIANQMMNEYKQKMERAYIDAQNAQKLKKMETIKAQREKFLAAEAKIVQKNEQEILEMLKELSFKGEKILDQSDVLSKVLVEKLT